MKNLLDKYFKISESGSKIRTETFAGLTTFMTMSYIIFVNPSIMEQSGMPVQAVMVATCLASAISTLIMGVLANYPIGLAPSMGINAFFTFLSIANGQTSCLPILIIIAQHNNIGDFHAFLHSLVLFLDIYHIVRYRFFLGGLKVHVFIQPGPVFKISKAGISGI